MGPGPGIRTTRAPKFILDTLPKPTNDPKGILAIGGWDECHGEVSGGGTMDVLYCAAPLSAAEREKGYRWCDYCRITKKLSYVYDRRRRRDHSYTIKSEWVVAL